MKFTCDRAYALSVDFFDHCLPGEVHRQMALHLEQCAACKEFARTYAATTKLCCGLSSKDIPPGAADRLLNALRHKLGGKP